MYKNQQKNKIKNSQFPYKKIIIVVSIFLLLGSIISLYFFSHTKEDSFSVFLQSGDVSFRTKDDLEYSKITNEKIEVKSNTFVKTGSNSKAVVITPNNSVMSLDENTEIQLKSNNHETNIQQFVGNVWYRINKLQEKEAFNTNTNQSTAAVRGTKYLVNVESNEKTRIVLTEGKIIASDEKLDDKKEVIEIQPNEQILFGTDQVKKDIIDINILNSNWMKQNKTMDIVFDKRKINEDIVNNWINTDQTKSTNLNEATELKIKYNQAITNNPCQENIQNDISKMKSQIPSQSRDQVMAIINNINDICNNHQKFPTEQKNNTLGQIKDKLKLTEEENKIKIDIIEKKKIVKQGEYQISEQEKSKELKSTIEGFVNTVAKTQLIDQTNEQTKNLEAVTPLEKITEHSITTLPTFPITLSVVETDNALPVVPTILTVRKTEPIMQSLFMIIKEDKKKEEEEKIEKIIGKEKEEEKEKEN